MGRRLAGIGSALVSLALVVVVAALTARDHREKPPPPKPRLAVPKASAESTKTPPGMVALLLPPPPPAPRPAGAKPPTPAPKAPPVPKPAPARAAPPRPPTPKAAPPVAEPAALPPHAEPAAPVRVTVNREMRHEGRVLLRLLEHGSGPTIEIAWPDDGRARGRLYRHLVQCYGMEDALMDDTGRLYGKSSAAGVPWRIDLDRYSGFLRRPLGRSVAEEEAGADRLRARHGLPGGRTVRIFPRRVDAVMLGGLARAVGDDYRHARTIDARYDLRGGRLLLDGLRVDGTPLKGAIDLTPARHRPC